MKALLAGLLLVGAQALACPNLTGTYTCTQDGQSYALQFSQTEANGVTVYTIKDPNNSADQGGSLPADNQVYRLQDSKEFKNATIRGWCEGEAFKFEQIGEYYQEDQHIGNLQLVVAMSLMNGNLLQETTGVFETGSGQHPIQDRMVCNRN